MSLLTANNVGVIDGTIDMPLNGAWTGDLVIDQSDLSGFDAGAQVTLAADSGFSLVGTVMPDRAGSFLDAVHVRLVGGAGQMGKALPARAYAQPRAFVRDFLNALMSDSGESLSSTVDTGFLGTNMVAWTRAAATTAQALNAFLAVVAPTFDWRFLADGTLWVGAETWDTSSDVFDVLSLNPTDGTAELGIVAPSILPGVTLNGVGKVARVQHVVNGDEGVRSHVWTDMANESADIHDTIGTIVRQQMSGIAYLGLYEAKVISQSGDLSTVDVQMLAPANVTLPGQQRVEVRAGTGVQVKFTPGAKVLLGWKGGDPRYPYVMPGLGGDGFTAWTLGNSTADNVITKQDFAALINAISASTYVPYPGGAAGPATVIAFVPPSTYASNTVKVQR